MKISVKPRAGQAGVLQKFPHIYLRYPRRIARYAARTIKPTTYYCYKQLHPFLDSHSHSLVSRTQGSIVRCVAFVCLTMENKFLILLVTITVHFLLTGMCKPLILMFLRILHITYNSKFFPCQAGQLKVLRFSITILYQRLIAKKAKYLFPTNHFTFISPF